MKHILFALVFISSSLCAMDKQGENQAMWFIESIRQCAQNQSDYEKAFGELKKSAVDANYEITDKSSLNILKIYELVPQNDNKIPDIIREIVTNKFMEQPQNKKN